MSFVPHNEQANTNGFLRTVSQESPDFIIFKIEFQTQKGEFKLKKPLFYQSFIELITSFSSHSLDKLSVLIGVNNPNFLLPSDNENEFNELLEIHEDKINTQEQDSETTFYVHLNLNKNDNFIMFDKPGLKSDEFIRENTQSSINNTSEIKVHSASAQNFSGMFTFSHQSSNKEGMFIPESPTHEIDVKHLLFFFKYLRVYCIRFIFCF